MANEGEFPKVDGDVLFETDVHYASGIIDAEAGETLAAGDVVFIYMSGHANEGEAWLSDANVQDKCRVTGICLSAGNDGDTVKVMTRGVYKTTGLTAKESYYLSATAGDWTTTTSGVRIGHAVSTTEIFIDVVQDDRDVVGTIKPWLQDHANMIANPLTAFWKLCDGTAISDAESPLNGGQAPDLNSTSRFIRGAGTSDDGTDDTAAGADTHTHSMGTASACADAADKSSGSGFSAATCSHTHTVNAGSTLPAYIAVTFLMKIK